MSFDRFKIIGDPYFYITKYTEKYYSDTLSLSNNTYGYVNKEALKSLDSIIDYSLYDNWTFGYWNNPYTHNPSPDGNVDLIIMYYRWAIWPPRTTGIASLGLYQINDTLDGKIIKFGFPGSGITNSGGAYGHSLYSVKHEIGHLLFGGDHPTHGNSNHYGFWGIMTSNPHLCITAYERERLNWINFNDINPGITNVTISDFVTTGSAYRIIIPGTNQAFILENHQKLDPYFDDPNHIWPGKGLFIYRVNNIDANHPLSELEDAFNKVVQMSNLLKADDMTFGKAKLFFAGKLSTLDPNRKQEAVRLNQEAINHFSQVTDPSRANERMRWTNQAQQNIQQLNQ